MSAIGAESSVFLPARPPAVPFPAVAKPGEVDRFLVNTLTWGLFVGVFIQKVAVAEFEITWFATTAMMAALFYRGRLRISTHRFVLYMVTMSLACFTQAFARDGTFTSLALTVVIGLPFVTVTDATAETRLAFLQRFQLLGLIACGFVLIDVVVQPLGMRMPSMEAFLPDSFQFKNYVYLQPLVWRSPYDKPNGFIFLEASFVSQFLALALVIELAYFRRLKYMVAYGMAMMGVSAGTGFVMVFLTAPFFIRQYLTPKLVALGLALALVVGAGAVATGFVDRMAQRTDEFGQHGQSGNARFVAPFTTIIDQFTVAPTPEMLWGYGAGSQNKSTDLMLIPPTKMILEFGAPTFFCYLLFACVFLFEGSRSFFAISWALMIDFMFINGGTVQPITSGLGYMLVAIWAPRRDTVAMRNLNVTLDRPEPDRAALTGPVYR